MPATLEDLRETLTAASGAVSLVPKIIDRLLLEYVRKYSPLYKAIPRKTWLTDTYYFNQRNALPPAQFTTEAPSTTDVAAGQSNYVQNKFLIKHLQSQIDVSTFAAKVAIVNGNLFDLELSGAAKAMMWLEAMAHLWGSAAATLNTKRPQWDGLDVQLGTSSQNKLDAGNAALTLQMLDSTIDAVKTVVAEELDSNWFFLLTPKMQSRLNGLFVAQQRFNEGLTKIFSRDDYGIPGAVVGDNMLAADAGFEVQTYRGIPLVFSSFLSSQGTMGAITTVDGGGSGSQLANQAYYYMLEAVTQYGISVASAEANVTPTAGHNVTVSWSTPTITDVFGNTIPILSYRLFRSNAASNASGTESLYAIIPAKDGSDNPVTSFSDTGIPSTSSSLFATYATQSAGAAAAPDGVTFPRTTSTTEDIFLVPRDPEYMLVAVVNEIQSQMLAPVNARTRQFALTSDMALALRAPFFGAKLGRVKTA